MKRLLAIAGLGLLALVTLLVGRAALLRPASSDGAPVPRIALGDEAAIVERLAAAIRIPTLSHQDAAEDDPAVFEAFRRHLERSYPALHTTLRRELVGERTLVYTWTGRDTVQLHLKRPHRTNERVRADDYLDSIRFYVRLLENAQAL